MVNPSNSNFIKFQDNFNIGYILLGNEIERDNNFFNKEIERLKNSVGQILKTQNLLEKENSRLSKEIKTLNNNNDKKFQFQINNLNNKIEKKNEEIKRLKFKSE